MSNKKKEVFKQVPIGFGERHRKMISKMIDPDISPSMAVVVRQAVVEKYERYENSKKNI